MVKVKTSELIGPALDWAVAKCKGFNPVFTRHYVTPSHVEDPKKVCIPASSWVQPFEPSTNWAQCGPIIDRERIDLSFESGGRAGWTAYPAGDTGDETLYGTGPAPQIAAMRCYVASKLGDEVEVPKELT